MPEFQVFFSYQVSSLFLWNEVMNDASNGATTLNGCFYVTWTPWCHWCCVNSSQITILQNFLLEIAFQDPLRILLESILLVTHRCFSITITILYIISMLAWLYVYCKNNQTAKETRITTLEIANVKSDLNNITTKMIKQVVWKIAAGDSWHNMQPNICFDVFERMLCYWNICLSCLSVEKGCDICVIWIFCGIITGDAFSCCDVFFKVVWPPCYIKRCCLPPSVISCR